MVQIIEGVPSKWARLGAGLGSGFSQGVSERLKGEREERSQSRLLQENSRLKQEEIRTKGQQIKDLFSRGAGNSKTKGDQLKGLEGDEIESSDSGLLDPEKFSDEEIAQVTIIDPNLGKSLQHSKDVALRERREEMKSKEKKIENLRKETLPIRQEIFERADTARRGIENKQKQLQLIDTGNINDPTYATLLESLPLHFGQRFLSPETVEYKAGLVQGYGDLKNIFSGATRVKEVEILEQKIADLYLTDQQKKSILRSAIDTQKADLIREEAASELEDRPLSLLQYRKEVEKLAKPKLDSLFNKIIDAQKSIIKDAENRKNIPLSDSDPEDQQIIDQILDEAGGDWRKAEKIAKKKGYKF